MIGIPRRANRGGGYVALALIVGSGIGAAGWVPPSVLPGAAPAAVAAAPSASSGEGAVAGRVAVSAVTVRLSITTRRSRARAITEVTASVTNVMRTKLSGAVVSLKVSSPGVAIKPTAAKVLGSIAGGRATSTAWTVCSHVARDVVIVVDVTVNGVTTSSAPTTVRLSAAARC